MNGRIAKKARKSTRMAARGGLKPWAEGITDWVIQPELELLSLPMRPHRAFSLFVAGGPLTPELSSTVAQSGLTSAWLWSYREHILEPCGGSPDSAEHAWELTLAFRELFDSLGSEYATALFGEEDEAPHVEGRFVMSDARGTL